MTLQLHHLGIDRRNLRALPLLPLVEVAWADGAIQDAERAIIIAKANTHSLSDEDRLMLGNWLAHSPSPGYLRVAHQALSWFRRHGDPAIAPTMLGRLVEDAKEVASAAGGWFGFGRVSRAERETIERLRHDLEAQGPDTFEMADEFHPDFGRKNPLVTLARTPDRSGEGDAVLSPLFGGHRLSVPDNGLLIGSSPETSVCIEGDPQVLGRHCFIDARSSGFYLNAQGPVWVNGERAIERRLLGGETIRLTDAVSFVFKLVRSWAA